MERQRHILLDRDGTIIVDRHYLADAAGVELLPNAAEGLRRMARIGFRLIVVTNQSGIARGYFDEAALAAMHARMRELLAAEEVAIDAIYHCPHADEHHCDCRKPRAGMAELAAREHAIDLRSAFVVGDKCADIGLGTAVGATTILVRTGHGLSTEQAAQCRPDYTADDLCDAADWIQRRLRSQP